MELVEGDISPKKETTQMKAKGCVSMVQSCLQVVSEIGYRYDYITSPQL